MRVVGAALCLVVGCGFSPSLVDGGTADMHDGAPMHDVQLATSDVKLCYGKGMLEVCFTTQLPTSYAPNGVAMVDTGTDANCTVVVTQPSGRDLCVIAAQTIDIAAGIRATGSRPLVLIGASSITIEAAATVDVASRNGTNTGAGGNDVDCVAPNTPAGDTGGGGGGAGGSFVGKGGDGAVGNSNGGMSAPGLATPTVTPTFVRGGCRGGVGGGNSGGSQGKAGASGGGAVYLIAGETLTIAGTIDAGGAGGQSTIDEQGGPGGGAGGMIGLDAPSIVFTGGLFANGGGGAEGGATGGTGGGGLAGGDGQRSTTNVGAGGAHASQGGAGGDGSVGNMHDGRGGATDFGGGGGGGGGAGYIYVFGTISGGQVSPS